MGRELNAWCTSISFSVLLFEKTWRKEEVELAGGECDLVWAACSSLLVKAKL